MALYVPKIVYRVHLEGKGSWHGKMNEYNLQSIKPSIKHLRRPLKCVFTLGLSNRQRRRLYTTIYASNLAYHPGWIILALFPPIVKPAAAMTAAKVAVLHIFAYSSRSSAFFQSNPIHDFTLSLCNDAHFHRSGSVRFFSLILLLKPCDPFSCAQSCS